MSSAIRPYEPAVFFRPAALLVLLIPPSVCSRCSSPSFSRFSPFSNQSHVVPCRFLSDVQLLSAIAALAIHAGNFCLSCSWLELVSPEITNYDGMIQFSCDFNGFVFCVSSAEQRTFQMPQHPFKIKRCRASRSIDALCLYGKFSCLNASPLKRLL